MTNQLIKVITKDEAFRAFALNGTNLVRQACQAHETSRIASVILGRALLATELLAQATLKGEERLNAKIAGRGPIGNIVTEADAKGSVRGYVTNAQLDGTLDDHQQLQIGTAVGHNGFLQITKFAPYSDPYIGQSQLVSGEIGDDFTYYLAQSEQIPSVIGVGVHLDEDGLVDMASGFLIQALPGATDEQLSNLEDKLKAMTPLNELISQGSEPEAILNNIFGENSFTELADLNVGLAAEPPKEEYAKMLATLPATEVQAMIDEDGGAEIIGKFSGKRHYFEQSELEAILEDILARNLDEDKD
ncbi:Hsp33 family molecular chaperone HslO [Convivina intestini]|uniref:33 kDa chaperonin n=1 Tax=Convivina intestini TaxID=1505726 RepID=A0A2U1DBH7_9LACO|nr:Hsp33 family molecular chaperone HslO [Convivina intestini]PVY85054.1 molecular chaperone Hsp33 [Convivina intestini]CAH1853535.1 33 kDa chaperonin [Convivina intestini]CAH1855616.1 33 kDa chaperonin [Convivina intestini]SDB89045.1 molecular chaperone Hsp33 [Leuconostocaceae bacterium R-53105]